MLSVETQLSMADIERLPNYRKAGANEYSSACPFCGMGEDRFRFWPERGNYWCRQCDAKGFITESNSLVFDEAQHQAWIEAEHRRQQAERQRQISVLDRIAQSTNAEFYHRQMTDRSYWYGQGLTDETINKYQLGYCPSCPTYQDSASHTIPIRFRGRLFNIRHRLATPGCGGKYRPEMAGLPPAIFNADVLDAPEWMTVVVEGEVKAMVLQQHGFSTVGIPGANLFKPKWAGLFAACSNIYIAFDPGADEQAAKAGAALADVVKNVYVCQVPVKPDDLLVKYGGTTRELFQFLMFGRKVCKR